MCHLTDRESLVKLVVAPFHCQTKPKKCGFNTHTPRSSFLAAKDLPHSTDSARRATKACRGGFSWQPKPRNSGFTTNHTKVLFVATKVHFTLKKLAEELFPGKQSQEAVVLTLVERFGGQTKKNSIFLFLRTRRSWFLAVKT